MQLAWSQAADLPGPYPMRTGITIALADFSLSTYAIQMKLLQLS